MHYSASARTEQQICCVWCVIFAFVEEHELCKNKCDAKVSSAGEASYTTNLSAVHVVGLQFTSQELM